MVVKMNPNFRDVKNVERNMPSNESGHLENHLWLTFNIGLLLFNQFLGFYTDKLQKLFS